MYQVWSAMNEEWVDSWPIEELQVLLDKHPQGVSFVAGDTNRTVYWRKRPRDEEMVAAIQRAIDGSSFADAAENVYNMLRQRGVSV